MFRIFQSPHHYILLLSSLPQTQTEWSYLIRSNTSGFSFSRSFILSFMAMMMVLALSSAPCLELFSAAPDKVPTSVLLYYSSRGQTCYLMLRKIYFYWQSNISKDCVTNYALKLNWVPRMECIITRYYRM